MITLWLINRFVQIGNQLLLQLFGNLVPTLNNLTSFISNYSIPQTLRDFFALTVLFLPMGTISVLFVITLVIVAIKAALAIIHVLSLGLVFGE